MLLDILVFLFFGWILSLFGFDTLVINGINEMFDKSISTAGYYIIMGLLAVVAWVIRGFGRS